ncbi:MAG: hypothetical protein AABW72_00625 [archaeon]
MDKKIILKNLEKMQSEAKQRNFVQSVEFIVTFKGLDLKKPSSQIDIKVNLPYATGKEKVTSALFAKTKSFAEAVKGLFNEVIFDEEIPKIPKQQIAKLIEYDVLMAEAGPTMLSVGKHLGQHLAPKGKMPIMVEQSPEKIKEILAASSTTVKITNKHNKIVPMIQVVIGKENSNLENLADNILTAYNALLLALPQNRTNVRAIYVKKSMSQPVKFTEGI